MVRRYETFGLVLAGMLVGCSCGGTGGGGEVDTDVAATEASEEGSGQGTSSGTNDGDGSTTNVTMTATVGSAGSSGDDDHGDSGDDTTGGGPTPSAGCNMPDPPSGDLEIDVDGVQGQYRVSLPSDYDPATPYPLGFAFHGANRTGPQCQQGDCAGFQSVMQDHAVLVYMTSVGGPGWTNEIDLNVDFFEHVLDEILDHYCIDESLVFTAGTSSGAHFVNILGCRLADRIAAIAPVAGVLFGTNCGGRVAALIIHGVDDSSFEAGTQARDFWREHDGCEDVTVPPIADVHASVVETPESHGCAEYQGCDPVAPVVWCEHSEGGYDGSTHGWPLFGGDRIWSFVSQL
jgi:polyhydroxybutyrate depolymerase